MPAREVRLEVADGRLHAFCTAADASFHAMIGADDDRAGLANLVTDVVTAYESGRLRLDEPWDYGSWRLLVSQRAGRLEIFEYHEESRAFMEGPVFAVATGKAQKDWCDEAGVEAHAPLFDQMVAVSEGVEQGRLAVNGVRHRAPSHMSGWYLTTELFDDDIASLRIEHLHHVLARRPNLAGPLALPPGYRFRIDGSDASFRFDPSVLEEE